MVPPLQFVVSPSMHPVVDVLRSTVTALTNDQAFAELWYSKCFLTIE